MIDWFALSNELPQHPKTRRLCLALGDKKAGWYIVALFAYCSKHCTKGVFSGRHAAGEIEAAAEWGGDPGVFVKAAVDAGFLDAKENGEIEIHDWWEWNGEVMTEAETKARAK
ncbi:MAG: hypothetical protein JST54_12615 [Deltaproteobacteria bacterium]|nr:hypothetical protein [Deltaproteobacteria bacterium]